MSVDGDLNKDRSVELLARSVNVRQFPDGGKLTKSVKKKTRRCEQVVASSW